MANPDFKKVILKDATLLWPKLDATYRFNTSTRQSEKCAETAQGATWSCNFQLNAEDGKAMWETLKTHYNDCRSRNSKLPEFKKVFGLKKNDDGTVVLSAKKNAMSKQGTPNKPPQVLAADLTPLADKAFWTNSVGTARLLAFPIVDPEGSGGISLMLDVLQVTEAVYGGEDLSDFSATEMKIEKPAVDDDPFGLPPVTEAPKASADLDDEIPF